MASAATGLRTAFLPPFTLPTANSKLLNTAFTLGEQKDMQ